MGQPVKGLLYNISTNVALLYLSPFSIPSTASLLKSHKMYTSKPPSVASLVVKLGPKTGVDNSVATVTFDTPAEENDSRVTFNSVLSLDYQQNASEPSAIEASLLRIKSIGRRKEGELLVKRLVSNNGERMLTCIKDVCHKIEILAILPQVMAKLVEGNIELEEILGAETMDAVFQLLDIQKNWLDINFRGPANYGVSKDQYMADRMSNSYKEVLRLITFNEKANWWFQDNLTPEVTQAVKIFYCQIQILEGLMYARLLMSPEEEIRRIQSLKETWIKEQRLLRKLKDLQEELDQLVEERTAVLEKLNEHINVMMSQVDGVDQAIRQELNKISAEAAKKELVTAKIFDQELQQLDGMFQKALKFATQMRAKFSDMENTWRKKRFKLQAELEALVERYDVEMIGRQDILDELTNDETQNQEDIENFQAKLKRIQLRHDKMLEEIRLKELAELARLKKKKRGKGKSKKGKGGSKKKKSKGKKKGKSRSKSKSKEKGKGRGKKKKGKKLDVGEGEEGETDYEDEEETPEKESAVPKIKKKRRTKKPKTGGRVTDEGEEYEGEGVEGDRAIKGKKPKKPKAPKKSKSPKKTDKKGKDKETSIDAKERLTSFVQQQEEMIEELEGEGYVTYDDEFFGEYESEQALLARAAVQPGSEIQELEGEGTEMLPKVTKKGAKVKKRAKSKKAKKAKKKVKIPEPKTEILEGSSTANGEIEGEWIIEFPDE